MTVQLTVLGLIGGVGFVVLARALLLPRGDLDAALRRYRDLEWPGTAAGEPETVGPATADRSLISRAGAALTGFRMWGDMASRDADLAVTGRTLDRHGVTLAWALLAGGSLPVVLGAGLRLIGLDLPLVLVAGLALAGAVAGAVATALELKRSAIAARSRFLRALSIWLELVSLSQAGGMGVESALEAASRVATDPAFEAISASLTTARHAGTSPWVGLARLGRQIGVPELDELAASLGLAGSEGARIRASLSAKSGSLRRRQMAEAQSKANSTTERLFFPSIVLMLGFMVFLMYPAAVSLAHVL